MRKDAKYVVRLSVEEWKRLKDVVARGRVAKATRERAMILLRADHDPAATDESIVELLGVGLSTAHRTRQRFVEQGFDGTLKRKLAANRQYRKLDGAQEAKLVALACSQAPAGRVCWTMQLLADKLVELQVVDSVAAETVRTMLKKTTSSRG